MQANQARNWEVNTPNQQGTPKKVAVRVRKRGWITKGEKVLYSMIATALIGAAIVMVSTSSTTDSLNREIQQLERTVEQQRLTNEGLAFEVRELSRPERIISIAEANGLKIQNAEVKQAQIVSNE